VGQREGQARGGKFMCGIVGYIGDRETLPIILDSLKRLEYRGYDSAGVALLGEDIYIKRTKGRIKDLEKKIDGTYTVKNFYLGVGHTRWATHGIPSDYNAHPHTDCSGEIVVVHNGIIENFDEIKKELMEKGHKFTSETDTEVVPHLIEECYNGDLLSSVMEAARRLKGSFALAIFSKKEPDKIIAVRKDSPLIIGIGEDGNFLASDIPALLPYTKKVIIMEDGEVAVIKKEEIDIFNINGEKLTKDILEVSWSLEQSEKKGYKHFMLKEIMEEGEVLKEAIRGRIRNGRVFLPEISDPHFFNNIKNIFLVACGTAYHAGMIGKYFLEDILHIPVRCEVASEFRYENPNVGKDSLLILVSQSGETADTVASLRLGKKKGAKTLGIVNVVGSTVARESDEVLYIYAGPEIAVASTKAYVAQILVLLLLSIYIGKLHGAINPDFEETLLKDILKIGNLAEDILERDDEAKKIAEKLVNLRSVFYIGRLLDYPTALEGALKLKEISYIHAEGYPAGELKHGPLALIEKSVPTFAITTDERIVEKMVSNIKEVKAREGKVFSISREDFDEIREISDETITIPRVHRYLTPILSVIPLQLIAYYTADMRGLDVDKPRNLAKSVTVE